MAYLYKTTIASGENIYVIAPDAVHACEKIVEWKNSRLNDYEKVDSNIVHMFEVIASSEDGGNNDTWVIP